MSRIPLVMLPGLDGTGIMFRPVVKELESSAQPLVVSYDQNLFQGYERLTEQVASMLPEEDFFLLGESFSGPIALKLAAARPEGLRGIILCATFVSNPSALVPSFLNFLVRAPLFTVWPLSVKMNVITTGRPHGYIRELAREVVGTTRYRVLAARTREAMRVDVTEELRCCGYPILYIQGSRDLVVWGHNLAKIKSINSKVKHVTLDASHLVLQEKPELSAREIIDFMEKVQGLPNVRA